MRNLDDAGPARGSGTPGGGPPKPARCSNRRWPLFIVGLLVVHVLLMGVAAAIATRDRSFAIVPDYYQRAIHWDQEQALIKSSKELGWNISLGQPGPRMTPAGEREITLALTDAAGQPVDGAAVSVVYFHHAHGEQTHDLKLGTTADGGRIAATVPLRYAGFWEFHFTATKGDKTFVQAMQMWVDPVR